MIADEKFIPILMIQPLCNESPYVSASELVYHITGASVSLPPRTIIAVSGVPAPTLGRWRLFGAINRCGELAILRLLAIMLRVPAYRHVAGIVAVVGAAGCVIALDVRSTGQQGQHKQQTCRRQA
jgi:hypothetical protein